MPYLNFFLLVKLQLLIFFLEDKDLSKREYFLSLLLLEEPNLDFFNNLKLTNYYLSMKNGSKEVCLTRRSKLFVKFLLAGFFLFTQLSAIAQQRTITGTVTGSDNEPIVGATVMIQGTTVGALTDINGRFSLPLPAGARTMIVSFVGYDPQTIEIGAGNVFNVILIESVTSLEEVVVVGYGTQKRISVTGAIVAVDATDLVKSPSATVSSSLAGRVTGLTSVQYSGQPGADEPNLYVRGLGSLSSSASQPLMLVDGVERSFSQLDPNEVQSISILKDASATAVYGIRGANGVIIVTTKRGTEGAPKISFTSSVGLQQPTRLVEMADSYLFATKHNAATLGDNPNATPVFSDAAIKAFKAGGNLIYPNTDWVNYLTKDYAQQNQHNFNISGGSKNLKYFVSLGYLNQDGLFNTFDTDYSYQFGYKRYNYRTNLDLDLTESTKISLTLGGRQEARQEPGSQPSESIWTVLYWAVPYSGMINDGKRILLNNSYIPTTEKKDGLNAIGWGSGYRQATNNVMNIDVGLTQDLSVVAKGLAWRIKYANNSNNRHDKTRTTSKATYDPFYHCDVGGPAGDSTIVFKKSGSDGLLGYSESSGKGRNWYMETALSYDQSFGSHNVTGLLLYNQSKTYYPSLYSDIPSGYVGLAARVTYDYRSKYLIDMNLGYNGSENFAPENRFGFFPAVSVGWTLSEENFLKDKVSWLDFLKLRASFGSVGNDRLGSNRFLYLPDSYSIDSGSYSFGTTTATNMIGAAEERLGNPLVTWERALKQNFGVDARFLNGSLSLSVDVFKEMRSNILTTRNTVPGILNITLPAQNIGEVENKGYEVELKWRDRTEGGLNYYLTGNMSFSRNKIIYMDEIPQNEPYLYRTGGRVNQPFGYVFAGFWTPEEVANYTEYADQSWVPRPGDTRYVDLNNDMVIDSDDQKAVGYPDYPEYIASLSMGADFKGFDISMLWNGVTNVSRQMNDTWRQAFADLGDRSLLKWLAYNSWTPETAETALAPRISFTGRINNTRMSDLWIRDASYIRLKNLELGYTLPTAFTKRYGVSNLRVYANGYNLLTFDRLKFMDPEGQRDYPLIKIYNLGVNVTF